MKKDTGMPLSKLLVDGAMTSNNLLMQMQADICGVPVGKFTYPRISRDESIFLCMLITFSRQRYINMNLHKLLTKITYGINHAHICVHFLR